jgi:hypothetical protein
MSQSRCRPTPPESVRRRDQRSTRTGLVNVKVCVCPAPPRAVHTPAEVQEPVNYGHAIRHPCAITTTQRGKKAGYSMPVCYGYSMPVCYYFGDVGGSRVSVCARGTRVFVCRCSRACVNAGVCLCLWRCAWVWVRVRGCGCGGFAHVVVSADNNVAVKEGKVRGRGRRVLALLR